MRRFLQLAFLTATAGAACAAPSFPKPDADKAFPQLKVYDAAGRPWRTAVEDWAGAKARVAQDPAWTAWLRQERTAVDVWIARHHDRVDWAAGWSHDGVSPKDGSRVVWEDKIPREEAQFFHSPSDPQIEITPKLFAWWVVTFRGRHVETMVRAAQLFRLTGDDRYATWAIGQMDLYADNFDHWAMMPTAKNARLFWQTLTEGSNLVKFTAVVRLLGDRVPAEQRQRWRTKFFDPEVAALNKTHHDIHNIATWQRCAVAEVALLFGDEKLWRQAIDGEFGLRQQMAQGITSDYLWYEQSLGYNNFVVGAVTTLFTTAGLYGRAGELALEMSTAENLMLAPLYLRFPNGQLPNPADSGGIPTAPNRGVFADTYRVFPTTLGLAEAAKLRDWNTLLDPPAAPPAPFVAPEVTSRNLETTRMAILRSGGWQVFLHYGQLTKSHSEAEALNYSAFYGDTDVTHDPGVVGYGSPLYRGYYTRGLNHNVPLVDGEAEVPPQRGELLSYSESPAEVAAAQPRYREDARAQRVLRIEGDMLIDAATVEATGGPKALGLALHLQGKVRLPETFATDSTFAQNRPDSFKHWRSVKSAEFQDAAEFDVAYARGLVLHVKITAPGAFRIWHGSSPDVPPRRRESLYLELKDRARKATFVTTMKPVAAPASR